MKGIHSDRLLPDRDNPREVAFDEIWQRDMYHNILDHLAVKHVSKDDPGAVRVFSPELASCTDYIARPIGEITERDRILAATLIQWLGSNVGMSFLRESLEKCGYQIVKKEKP